MLSLTELSERQRHYLQIIETSSTVLFQLISNVLDVTKIESGQMAFEHAASIRVSWSTTRTPVRSHSSR
ncbi:hypothetical protein GTA07_14105 [Rhodococcus hoagii]|nr:hypothetical protein [Prescottella equi]